MNHIFKAIALKIEQLDGNDVLLLAAMSIMAAVGITALFILPRPL